MNKVINQTFSGSLSSLKKIRNPLYLTAVHEYESLTVQIYNIKLHKANFSIEKNAYQVVSE